MPELTFTITNLTCEACVKVSTMTLRKLPGITDVSVDLSTGAVHVLSEEQLNQTDVAAILKTKGYDVTF
jgi:copper chaperone CopZ